MSGQALTSVIELFLSNFLLVMINSESVFGLERVLFVILNPMMTNLVSVILFLTSPELKRHYFYSKRN